MLSLPHIRPQVNEAALNPKTFWQSCGPFASYRACVSRYLFTIHPASGSDARSHVNIRKETQMNTGSNQRYQMRAPAIDVAAHTTLFACPLQFFF